MGRYWRTGDMNMREGRTYNLNGAHVRVKTEPFLKKTKIAELFWYAIEKSVKNKRKHRRLLSLYRKASSIEKCWNAKEYVASFQAVFEHD